MRSESDKLLVGLALQETETMTLAKAAAHLRVSYETVGRWRRGNWARVSPEIRDILRKRLTELGHDVSRGTRELVKLTDEQKIRAYDAIRAIVLMELAGERGNGGPASTAGPTTRPVTPTGPAGGKPPAATTPDDLDSVLRHRDPATDQAGKGQPKKPRGRRKRGGDGDR